MVQEVRREILEIIGAGLSSVDQRKIEYGEVPKSIVEAQNRAIANRIGLWSLHEEKKEEDLVVESFFSWIHTVQHEVEKWAIILLSPAAIRKKTPLCCTPTTSRPRLADKAGKR